MPRIFVSYRRDDSGGHTGRLADRLKDRFGADNVFMDVADISIGVDFKDELARAIQSSNVVLVVVGRTWLTCANPASGQRRIDDPDDWVRLEIVEALQREIPVVPVYVQGAPLLDESSLPEPLKPLATRQAAFLHDGQWHGTVEDLVLRLSKLPGFSVEERTRSLGKRTVVILAGLAVVTAVWILGPRLPSRDNETPISSPTDPPAQQTSADDVFSTHEVIGGYWHESAFNSYVEFLKGGKLSGTYYQYTLTGKWGPLSDNPRKRIWFSAHLVEEAKGLTFGFEPWMSAEVSGDTLKVAWPD